MKIGEALPYEPVWKSEIEAVVWKEKRTAVHTTEKKRVLEDSTNTNENAMTDWYKTPATHAHPKY